MESGQLGGGNKTANRLIARSYISRNLIRSLAGDHC